MKPVALVTARGCAEIDGDLPLAEAALAAAGLAPRIVEWDDHTVDWANFAGVVIRSTWDYTDRRPEFLAWAETVESVTRLANPAAVVEWNTSKRYLADLEAAGVPTVPTAWITDGDDIPDGWTDLVVKPAVSAGGRLSGRYRDDAEEARLFVSLLLERGHDVLVQPYLQSVDNQGEIGVYFFGHELSHAVRKGAILEPGRPPVDDYQLAAGQSVTSVPLSSAPTDFARSVLDELPLSRDLLYARVDCVRGDKGEDLVLEVELVEPSLFLTTDPESSIRFAHAVAEWLAR